MKAHNFRELNIWKFSMETVESVYQIAEKLPSEEKFKIIDGYDIKKKS
mgnify:CR=1 FL=1